VGGFVLTGVESMREMIHTEKDGENGQSPSGGDAMGVGRLLAACPFASVIPVVFSAQWADGRGGWLSARARCFGMGDGRF
jgi:hypothetical protein